MGAEVFHGRVRDGIGCIILAMTTGPPCRILMGCVWLGFGCVPWGVCPGGFGVGWGERGLVLCAGWAFWAHAR